MAEQSTVGRPTSVLHRSLTYLDVEIGPVTVPLSETNVYCTVDSSGGSDSRNATTATDKVGWCVNAVDQRGHWMILELESAYLSDEMFVQKLYEIDDKYAPRFAVELMPHLAQLLRLLFTRNQRHIAFVPLKFGKRSKVERITRLRAQLRFIHFLDDIRQGAQYLLRNWHTNLEHGDDALDAMGYQLDIARSPSVEDIAARRQLVENRLQDAALARLPKQDRDECQRWIDYDKRQGHSHINDDMRHFMGFE
jgi:hypothetical protein